MWSKNFRKCLIGAIYQNLFWASFNETEYKPEWESLMAENYNSEVDKFKAPDLQRAYKVFLANKADFTDNLKSFANQWERTFDLIQACLFAFETEYFISELPSEEKNKMIGSYIKFAQDFAGGDNPALVHAVMSRVVESKKE
jgi:transcription termination factor NusB